MAGRITAHVFIDANTALHFRRPDQIDWPRLTRASDVILVAAPILLRELENQKIVNASRKLRQRAREHIKWLCSFVPNPVVEVRSGVRWLFLPYEPEIDFAAERLSLGIADDHLIASVLDYAPEREGSVFVATADVGLDVKLRARGIKVLALPEDARLPVEPDPLEQENIELWQEIARLQARMPKLSVTFEDGTQHHAIRLSKPHSADVPPLAQIEAEHAPMVGPGEAYPRWVALTFAGHLQQFGVSGDRVDAYNRELIKYHHEYERYLADLDAWQEKICLHATLELVVANDGTAPASDIDLELEFPEAVTPVDMDDFPREPKAPDLPRRPRGLMDISDLPNTDYLSSLIRSPNLSGLINPNYDGVPVVDQESTSVRISFSSLKHGFTCDPFLIRFRNRRFISAFRIHFRLSAAELPHAHTGELHVRIDDEEA